MNEKLIIGSHVGMNGPDFYLGSVKEAISYGSTAFMFYTGAPQNSFRKPISELKVNEGKKLLEQSNIAISNIVVHAPYIINLANTVKPELRDSSVNMIVNELRRTAAFGADKIVLHPGSHVNQGSKIGMKALSEALDEILSQDGTNVKIAIETMAGKGSEIGISFDEVAEIINNCQYKERLGVCLDTCHVHDAGYDLTKFDDLLKEFDQKIGLERLLVVHLNDSKNEKAAHKDRHENLGYGFIGFDILYQIANHPLLVNIPKILETPYVNNVPPYKKEIEMLRSGVYEEGWREKL